MSTPSIRIEPVSGSSKPAMSPSSVDLPLPEGPTIATQRPRATTKSSGWRIVRRSLPLVTDFETLAQLDHGWVALSRGASASQTRFATIRAPSAVGWILSD